MSLYRLLHHSLRRSSFTTTAFTRNFNYSAPLPFDDNHPNPHDSTTTNATPTTTFNTYSSFSSPQQTPFSPHDPNYPRHPYSNSTTTTSNPTTNFHFSTTHNPYSISPTTNTNTTANPSPDNPNNSRYPDFLSNATNLTTNPTPTYTRSSGFSSAEEAAAERRRRKRRLRIEPPLHALRRDPSAPRPRPNPNAPRLPDSTSALVGPRLNLHNRVQSLIRGGDVDAASQTARRAVWSNTRPTVFTCNAVIASYYRAGRYKDAIELFEFFFRKSNIVPNVVSYNFLINTHCDAGDVDMALDVYKHILENAPFGPSHVTYKLLTKGLVSAGRISEAIDLLREMLNKGHGADSLVYNNLIAGFLELDNLERANELFDELKERCLVYDGVVNATFMEYYFKKGMVKEAMESYQSLLAREFKMIPATCNVLLEVLLKYGKSNDANALFEHMLNTHKPPNFHALNSETFNIMVNEQFRLGNISEARLVFRRVGTKDGAKPFAMDALGYNNMIGKLCDNELVAEADNLFAEMISKSVMADVTTYRTLIDAYFKEERVDDVLQLFNKLLFETSLRPSAALVNSVFDRVINKGRIEQAGEILGRMGGLNQKPDTTGNGEILGRIGVRDHKPDATTYELVLTSLCKEGKLDYVRELLGQMVKDRTDITPTLRSTVDEGFGKEGRIVEIERLLGRPFEARQGGFQHAPQPGNQRVQPAPQQVMNNQGYQSAPHSIMSNQGYPQAPQHNQGYPQAPQPFMNNQGFPQASQPVMNKHGYPQPAQPVTNNQGYPQAQETVMNNQGYQQAPRTVMNNQHYQEAPQPVRNQNFQQAPPPVTNQGFRQAPPPVSNQGHRHSPPPVMNHDFQHSPPQHMNQDFQGTPQSVKNQGFQSAQPSFMDQGF